MIEFERLRMLGIIKIHTKKGAVPSAPRHSAKGFTLLELAMVILISGIIMTPLIKLYTTYLIHKKITVTKEHVGEASSAMARFSQETFPCPSNRSLPTADPNHGLDVCVIAGFTLAGVPDCVAGLEQGICKTPGARDTVDDADTVAGNNNEFILIGGVPTKTIVSGAVIPIPGTTEDNVLDAWGMKLTYAVSYTSVTAGDADTRYKNGVIAVHDEFGNNTAGTNNDAHFIVLSHGTDGLGAFSSEGVRRNCAIGNRDGENCDGDNVFVQGLAQYEGTWRYDDFSYVETDQSGGLWREIAASDSSPSNHIRTIPTGAIGVDLNATLVPGSFPPAGAEVMLDVNGSLRADTVRTPEVCLQNGGSCINAGTLFNAQTTSGATQNDCPAGQVVINISNGRVTCGKVDVSLPGVNIRCPAGTWVEQILTDGKIKCTGGTICPGGPGCV